MGGHFGGAMGGSLCLIDIKEGVLAAALRAPDAKMPRDTPSVSLRGRARFRRTWGADDGRPAVR
jgi:hypothetical protein